MSAFGLYFKYRTNIGKINIGLLTCAQDLGINHYGSLNVKSLGVGGDILTEGDIIIDQERIPIVIKIFSLPCPYLKINHAGKTLIRTRPVTSPTRFEIGNIIALTQIILLRLKPISPHITFAFRYKVCPWGYESDKSKCDPRLEVPSGDHLVPENCNGQLEQYPQCAFRTSYDDGLLRDEIRYLVVERANGDLEQWIQIYVDLVRNRNITLGLFDYIMSSILVMITYTLFVLDDFFDGFVHGDLGPRNILYVQGQPSDKLVVYKIHDEQFAVPQVAGILPKLWDFDKTRINGLNRTHFPYLSDDEATPDQPQFREDLSILLNKIEELIIPINSTLRPTIRRIMSQAQTMNNRGICMLFLKDPYIQRLFQRPIDPNDVEYVFSYP